MPIDEIAPVIDSTRVTAGKLPSRGREKHINCNTDTVPVTVSKLRSNLGALPLNESLSGAGYRLRISPRRPMRSPRRSGRPSSEPYGNSSTGFACGCQAGALVILDQQAFWSCPTRRHERARVRSEKASARAGAHLQFDQPGQAARAQH
ncbi:hypothetical protein [Actinomadura verrucosospora]|uniref:hypothetical protein n=1 Tax=Actinomadura verrucosospora TaxID=46165 RepID=UPI001564F647|nr:hypothetical protein [Actinomadura verrucosospora]